MHRVMIVDDEREVREALEDELSLYFKVEAYECAHDALERLHEQRFDALVSDVRMPGTDGVTLLKQAAQVDPAMVRVFLTGHADEEITGAALELSAYKLRKPWGDELQILLHNAFVHRDHLCRMRGELDGYMSVSGPEEAEVDREEVYAHLRETLEAFEWVQSVSFQEATDLSEARWYEACPPMREGDLRVQRAVVGDQIVEARWTPVGVHCERLVEIAFRRAVDALRMRDLLDEVRARADELRRAQDEVMRRDRLAVMGAMVGSVAHDVRNPLFALRCNMPLLEENLEQVGVFGGEISAICEDNRLAVDTIWRVVQAMERVAARPEESEPVDVGKSFDLCRKLLRRDFQDANVTLTTDAAPGLVVEATSGEMAQILINVLTNALAAAPRGSVVTMNAVDSDAEVRVRVCDQGPTLDDADAASLFSPFKGTTDGIGVGLCIAREMARRHGGDLEVRPSAEGSCLELRLPKAE
ncbi:MAG: response regulator [Myxococcota bacterium]